MKTKLAPVLGVFLLSTLILSNAHAHLMKIGDANTCVFQSKGPVKCPIGFATHSETTCRGQSVTCADVAEKTCGKNLAWVHQGTLKFNLKIAEISDASGNKFSGDEAEKQLKAIFQGMPIER